LIEPSRPGSPQFQFVEVKSGGRESLMAIFATITLFSIFMGDISRLTALAMDSGGRKKTGIKN
jgi:hypothetical protein